MYAKSAHYRLASQQDMLASLSRLESKIGECNAMWDMGKAEMYMLDAAKIHVLMATHYSHSLICQAEHTVEAAKLMAGAAEMDGAKSLFVRAGFLFGKAQRSGQVSRPVAEYAARYKMICRKEADSINTRPNPFVQNFKRA